MTSGVVTAAPRYVSRLDAAINAQHFNLTVTAGGAIKIRARDTGEHLTTITSAISSPGPVWNEFNLSATVGSWKVSYAIIKLDNPPIICTWRFRDNILVRHLIASVRVCVCVSICV